MLTESLEFVVVSELVIVIVLTLIAAIFAGIELVRSKGQALIAWAVLFVALAVIIERL